MTTWFDLVLAEATPDVAAKAMNCSIGTAAKQLNAHRAELLARAKRSAETSKDPAAAAVSRLVAAFLASNTPSGGRRRPQLDRAFS